jgi:hypothetical protein
MFVLSVRGCCFLPVYERRNHNKDYMYFGSHHTKVRRPFLKAYSCIKHFSSMVAFRTAAIRLTSWHRVPPENVIMVLLLKKIIPFMDSVTLYHNFESRSNSALLIPHNGPMLLKGLHFPSFRILFTDIL